MGPFFFEPQGTGSQSPRDVESPGRMTARPGNNSGLEFLK